MNAPASRLTADPIGTLVPWAEGEEKRHREGLLRARDLASSNLRAASSRHAIELLWQVIETATAWAYVGATVDELADARKQCIRLAQCAGFAEREPVR
jgi:hypothetical protein